MDVREWVSVLNVRSVIVLLLVAGDPELFLFRVDMVVSGNGGEGKCFNLIGMAIAVKVLYEFVATVVHSQGTTQEQHEVQ